MEIDTGDTQPKKQVAHQMPFAIRAEVAKQLHSMQESGVMQLSSSPVKMVRKSDETHRFCEDYRQLNTVAKVNTFPLPRIDDLLDQLRTAKYFTTCDLASGYWQLCMHPNSVEKMAFATPQGLHKFRLMPFSLTNAPAWSIPTPDAESVGRSESRRWAWLRSCLHRWCPSVYPDTWGPSGTTLSCHPANSRCWIEAKAKQMSLHMWGSGVLGPHGDPTGAEDQCPPYSCCCRVPSTSTSAWSAEILRTQFLLSLIHAKFLKNSKHSPGKG